MAEALGHIKTFGEMPLKAFSECSEDDPPPSPFEDSDGELVKFSDARTDSVIMKFSMSATSTPAQFHSELGSVKSVNQASDDDGDSGRKIPKEVGMEPGTYRIIDLYCLKEQNFIRKI